jgi:hypothetical protein
MSIWSFLAHLFNSLFNATRDAWNKLPKNIQDGLLNGSGILNIINQYADQDPKLVIATIQANYPNENLDLIYTGLVAVAKSFNLIPGAVPATLEEVVALIQAHLKSVEATVWPAIIQAAAGVLATILSGSGTPFEIISTLLQFVYTNFVKPKEIVLASVPATLNSNTTGAIADVPSPPLEPAS